MKSVIALLVFVLGIGHANALVCSLKKESTTKRGQFDQNIFTDQKVLEDGATEQLIIIQPNGAIIENLDMSKIDSQEKLNALDKSIFAFVSRNEDGAVAIGTGSVDISQKDNFMSPDSMAVGGEEKVLSVMNFSKKIALSCFNK